MVNALRVAARLQALAVRFLRVPLSLTSIELRSSRNRAAHRVLAPPDPSYHERDRMIQLDDVVVVRVLIINATGG
jgi:uncharacterized protein YcaQ